MSKQQLRQDVIDQTISYLLLIVAAKKNLDEREDPLPFEKCIFHNGQLIRDDDHRTFAEMIQPIAFA
jgi:hypothetical protein